VLGVSVTLSEQNLDGEESGCFLFFNSSMSLEKFKRISNL
jgi:hypothetical protein